MNQKALKEVYDKLMSCIFTASQKMTQEDLNITVSDLVNANPSLSIVQVKTDDFTIQLGDFSTFFEGKGNSTQIASRKLINATRKALKGIPSPKIEDIQSAVKTLFYDGMLQSEIVRTVDILSKKFSNLKNVQIRLKDYPNLKFKTLKSLPEDINLSASGYDSSLKDAVSRAFYNYLMTQ